MDFQVLSNIDQVLRYIWKGEIKHCRWSETETGRFDFGEDAVGQDALESTLIDRYLDRERDRGNT